MTKCLHKNCHKEAIYEDNCIFHCEKNDESGWYILKDNKKKWNKTLVKKFWKEIRNKIEDESKNEAYTTHDFSFYIFPEFNSFLYVPNLESTNNLIPNDFKFKKVSNLEFYETLKDFNFWKANEQMIFSKKVDFWEAKFMGNVYIPYTTFLKEITLSKANFLEEVDFEGSHFIEELKVWNTRFNKEINLSNSTFSNETKFDHSTFHKEVSFLNALFKKDVYFWNTEFSNNANFENTTFLKTAYFRRTIFLGKTKFWNTNFFWKIYFRSVTFSPDHQTFFKNVKFNGFSKNKNEIISADFHNIIFPETVLFRKTDLSRVSFLDSNLEKARFDECEWSNFNYCFKNKLDEKGKIKEVIEFKKSKPRNVLWDEFNIRDNRNTWKRFFWIFYTKEKRKFKEIFRQTDKQKYQQVENLNRQFKKNFDDKKDYQTADDFYIGEMSMRRKSFAAEVKDISFWRITLHSYGKRFFLWFYKWISNYNSNPTWALIWLIGIIFSFTIIFHISEYKINPVQEFQLLKQSAQNNTLLEFTKSNWLKPIHYSFTSSIPLISFPEELERGTDGMNGWTVFFHYMQVLSSTIVWALLILSLRRKFKR